MADVMPEVASSHLGDDVLSNSATGTGTTVEVNGDNQNDLQCISLVAPPEESTCKDTEQASHDLITVQNDDLQCISLIVPLEKSSCKNAEQASQDRITGQNDDPQCISLIETPEESSCKDTGQASQDLITGQNGDLQCISLIVPPEKSSCNGAEQASQDHITGQNDESEIFHSEEKSHACVDLMKGELTEKPVNSTEQERPLCTIEDVSTAPGTITNVTSEKDHDISSASIQPSAHEEESNVLTQDSVSTAGEKVADSTEEHLSAESTVLVPEVPSCLVDGEKKSLANASNKISSEQQNSVSEAMHSELKGQAAKEPVTVIAQEEDMEVISAELSEKGEDLSSGISHTKPVISKDCEKESDPPCEEPMESEEQFECSNGEKKVNVSVDGKTVSLLRTEFLATSDVCKKVTQLNNEDMQDDSKPVDMDANTTSEGDSLSEQMSSDIVLNNSSESKQGLPEDPVHIDVSGDTKDESNVSDTDVKEEISESKVSVPDDMDVEAENLKPSVGHVNNTHNQTMSTKSETFGDSCVDKKNDSVSEASNFLPEVPEDSLSKSATSKASPELEVPPENKKEETSNDTEKHEDKPCANELDDEILLIGESEPSAPEPCTKKSFKTVLKASDVKPVAPEPPESIIIDDVEISDVQNKSLSSNDSGGSSGKCDTELEEKSGEAGVEHSTKTEDKELQAPFENGKKRPAEECNGSDLKRPKVDAVSDSSLKGKTNQVSEDDEVVMLQDNEKTPVSVNESAVCVTSEILQGFIRGCVRSFLKKKKQENIERLNKQTKSMQSASTLWKETAKHLEKSVLELTTQSQKLEKRKLHSSSVKNLSNRSIGIQVNEEKMKHLGRASSEHSTRKSVDQKASGSTLSLPPSVLLNPPSFTNQVANTSSTTSPSLTSRQNSQTRAPPLQRPSYQKQRSPHGTSSSSPISQHHKVLANSLSHTQDNRKAGPPASAPKGTVNLIDLTDEDESSRTSRPSSIQNSRTIHASASNHLKSTVNEAANHKSLPMSIPVNGFISQPVSRLQAVAPDSSAILMGAGNPLIPQSMPPSKTQLMPSNVGALGTAGSQFQLVTVPNSQGNIRQGTMFALVPSTRPGVPGPGGVPSNLTLQSYPKSSVQGIPVNHFSTPLPQAPAKSTSHSLPPSVHINSQHPAPLPIPPPVKNVPSYAKKCPPKPGLKISRVSQGIVLSWNMPSLSDVEVITSYQLFAYQETDSAPPSTHLWKKVGDVKALPLPMACTLTQFQEGNKYHFAVRAVDQYGRSGVYSDPSTIFLGPK
ncbi:activating transcription factor 7-interacting protein 1 isoform X2 [Aplysia californica]|uniref:Activating transcription factor 7-interacting protein 1 isoform X2 n=1 Tax=Aplysia californica TaxID=6500 RepID=A0ABM1A2J2_APLCA|nr:activating transcription factor 7-interacting protein 1 isoform X2 [Aplysia californica]